MGEICRRWQQLENFCDGCRNECDQKCIIDNHEVEVLQVPAPDLHWCVSERAFCPSERASVIDLCTGQQRVAAYTDSPPSGSQSFRTQLTRGIAAPASSERSYMPSGSASVTPVRINAPASSERSYIPSASARGVTAVPVLNFRKV